MASCTLLKSSLGTVEIRSHHAHDSTLFIELGEVHKDVMVIQCGLLLRNNNFDCLYVCFCHLQFRWLSNKLCTSDANHTLSSLSAHSATCFSHSCTSLGLQQSNMSLIKKGHQSISSSSISYVCQVLTQFLQHQPHLHLHQDFKQVEMTDSKNLV